jgi:hypothetical protein
MANTLELRNNKSISLFVSIVSSLFFCYLLYEEKKFESQPRNVFGWIIFFLLLATCIISWVGYFDKSVKVTINEQGIFWTRSILFFPLNKELVWTNVQSCYLSDNSSKGVQDLNFNFTDKINNKEYKLSLNTYDKNPEEINEIIEFYSKKFKFGFLGINDEI